MLIDGRDLPSNTVLEGDICVAGAGPAGITLARELSCRGMHVVLIEAGGLEHDVALDPFVDGESSGAPYYPLTLARSRVFGGSSERWKHYGGWRARPLEADDFQPHEWVAHSGWPFRLHDLRDYYQRAQAAVGLETQPLDAGWGDEPVATPLSRAGRRLRAAGLPFAEPNCFVETLEDLAASPHVTLLLHSSVTDLPGAGDRIDAVEVAATAGQRFTVRAERVVLALGGIENARTLLAARRENGVGNERDQVGRYFMEHPTMSVGAVRPRSPEAFEALSRYQTQSPNPPPGMDHRVVISEELRSAERLQTAAFNLTPIVALRTAPGVRAVRELRRFRRITPRVPFEPRLLAGAVAGAADVARFATRRFAGRTGPCDALNIEIVAEQEPNPRSRVLLSADRDPLGVPRARLHWQLSAGDRHTILRSAELVAEAIRESRAGDVDLFIDARTHLRPDGHYHHLGTTRMSADPGLGVVDADCRVHSVENLYVAGGSVFPTAGWANPTLTIVALAIRLADHLAGLEDGGGQALEESIGTSPATAGTADVGRAG